MRASSHTISLFQRQLLRFTFEMMSFIFNRIFYVLSTLWNELPTYTYCVRTRYVCSTSMYYVFLRDDVTNKFFCRVIRWRSVVVHPRDFFSVFHVDFSRPVMRRGGEWVGGQGDRGGDGEEIARRNLVDCSHLTRHLSSLNFSQMRGVREKADKKLRQNAAFFSFTARRIFYSYFVPNYGRLSLPPMPPIFHSLFDSFAHSSPLSPLRLSQFVSFASPWWKSEEKKKGK